MATSVFPFLGQGISLLKLCVSPARSRDSRASVCGLLVGDSKSAFGNIHVFLTRGIPLLSGAWSEEKIDGKYT